MAGCWVGWQKIQLSFWLRPQNLSEIMNDEPIFRTINSRLPILHLWNSINVNSEKEAPWLPRNHLIENQIKNSMENNESEKIKKKTLKV